MAIKFFDMFAGIGGFRSGLEAIGGFECIGYCEIDKYAKQAYEAMYDTGGELYFEDARKITPFFSSTRKNGRDPLYKSLSEKVFCLNITPPVFFTFCVYYQ